MDNPNSFRVTPLCIVGLGYVGLTTACAFANAGLDVIGLDTDQKKVRAINKGEWPLDPGEPELPSRMHRLVKEGKLKATTRYREAVQKCFAFIIAVPTPLYVNREPNYERLEAAVFNLAWEAEEKKLIVIASTVSPRTTQRLADEMNEAALCDFVPYLAHAPERLSAGNLWRNFHRLTRIIGGLTPEATDLASLLYEYVTPRTYMMLTDAMTAEVVKTAENAYRDVQIAFAHELSWICEKLGVNFWDVREMVNSSPGRDVHSISAGVGGHCLPKDTYLLQQAARQYDTVTLLSAARTVNEFQSRWIALTIDALLRNNVTDEPSAYRIALLGTAYKADTRDTRNSPARQIAESLPDSIHCFYQDPYVEGLDVDWYRAVRGKDMVVFVQPHRQYLKPDWGALRDLMIHPIVVDCTGEISSPPDDFVFWQIGTPIHGQI